MISLERCDGCGFEYRLGDAPAAAEAIVSLAHQLGEALQRSDRELTARRLEPERWSPLEYTCHVRDVLLVQRERVLAARREDRPSFAPMGRDERVAHDGYADQSSTDVVRQLGDAASLFANDLGRLGVADWERTLVYNYPTPLERSLRWVAVHTVHEVRHHLGDVVDQLGEPSTATSP